ncbi:MAG: tRNA-dihydrouridine synthase [Planctomycetota bacterium]
MRTPGDEPPERIEPPARRSLRFGSLEVPGPAVQAALSGYSDLPMRRVARRFGAPYALHEVVVDSVLLQEGKLTRRVLDVAEDDHPVGGQIMGAEPEVFGRAARLMVEAGFDVIDINFGCPVKKVLGRNRGGALLGDPETALGIVDSVLEAVDSRRPVTVKMRRGTDETEASDQNFWAVAEGAVERGVAGITVHPRTVRQRYVGPSDWGFLSRVRRRFPDLTLLGSGDLFGPFDVLAMLRETGVDGVTLARGAIGNPFLFRQVNDAMRGRDPEPPSLGEQCDAIRYHAEQCLQVYGEALGYRRLRPHLVKYASLHPEGAELRTRFARSRSFAECEQLLAECYPESRWAERATDAQALAESAQSLRACGAPGEGKQPIDASEAKGAVRRSGVG